MAVFRVFEWTVKEGMEAEHERAMAGYLRHWQEEHPRVLSVRYFRPHPDNPGDNPRRRICFVESESPERIAEIFTVERTPACAQASGPAFACAEEGRFPHTLWQDGLRELWKE